MKKIKNPFAGMEEKGYNCFACCPSNPFGLKMEFYEDGDEIVSFWEPDGEHQSWINTLHGGIQAALLDELCGWVVFRKFQTGAVTSKMEVRYRKPVKISEGPLTLRAKVVDQHRNIITISTQIFNSSEQLCTEGRCVFFILPNLPK